jgi:hypothetical protein
MTSSPVLGGLSPVLLVVHLLDQPAARPGLVDDQQGKHLPPRAAAPDRHRALLMLATVSH